MPKHADPRTLIDVLMSKVAKSDGCWNWTGRLKPDGYAVLGFLGANLLAHRVSYELLVGPIPPRMFVLHRCDNPPCVRPDHLFLGTAGDNSRDMTAKGRHHVLKMWNSGRCANGHDITNPDNVYVTDRSGRPAAAGRRSCRRCKSDKDAARYAAHPERWLTKKVSSI